MIAMAATILVIGATGLALIATLALAVQAFGVIFRRERPNPSARERPPIAILVPAHNESAGLANTLQRLRQQMDRGDRLLVIADNCTDDTAGVAQAAGAEVLIRDEPDRRGKGYALAAGLEHLGPDAAEVFVFVDADCRFSLGALGMLARACAGVDAPVQCRNLMIPSPGAERQSKLAEFAWRVRNDFRPTGYARLGLPCQLFGTGMALPRRLANPAMFATGHVAEDLEIGLDCAMQGDAPRYERPVLLLSHFPETSGGQDQQKQRWVHGHLAIIASHVPKLAFLAARRRSLALLALAADVLVPPLTLLAALHGGLLVAATALLVLTGSWLALALALPGVLLFVLAMAAAWHFCGRGLIGQRELRQIPGHMTRVARSALAFATGRRSGWVRADRDRLP